MFSPTQIEKIKKGLRAKPRGDLHLAFHALGDPCRLYIFRILLREQEVCVTDVAKVCDISVAAASQQLRILELTGLVVKERMGQMVCYALRRKNLLVQSLIKIIS